LSQEDPSKQPENGGFWGKITPKEAFQSPSINVQQGIPIDVFAGISCRSVPLQRKANSMYPSQNTHLSPPLCASLAQGVKILTREI